jgi:hypothetical protein
MPNAGLIVSGDRQSISLLISLLKRFVQTGHALGSITPYNRVLFEIMRIQIIYT